MTTAPTQSATTHSRAFVLPQHSGRAPGMGQPRVQLSVIGGSARIDASSSRNAREDMRNVCFATWKAHQSFVLNLSK